MTEKRFAFVIDNGENTFYDLSENGEIMNMNETEDMLNKLDEDNKQYKILVESLKDENQKLKLRLKDLGVEYY
jgi:DnaJ-domain-containing protein 1